MAFRRMISKESVTLKIVKSILGHKTTVVMAYTSAEMRNAVYVDNLQGKTLPISLFKGAGNLHVIQNRVPSKIEVYGVELGK